MDPTVSINERVEVIALHKKSGDISTNCLPWKMRYQNRDILFTKLCLRHPTSQGKRMVHVFDMTDGTNDYRLEFDAESLIWTLAAIVEG